MSPPRTARVRLRRLRQGDEVLLDRLDHEPDVLRHISREPPTIAEQHRWVAVALDGYQRSPEHGRMVAESLTGQFLGWFALSVHDDDPSSLELGYRLLPSAWGRGLATEVGRALIAHAFARLAATEVWAQSMAVNAASRRVMEKCGMRHTQTLHLRFDDPLPGTEQGEVRYVITQEQWRSLPRT